MSIKIALDNQPEFYTNLDGLSGTVFLTLPRSEQIGSIVVKLEGESGTALQVPRNYGHEPGVTRVNPPPGPPGSIVSENHKILYKIVKVFPDDYYESSSSPYGAYPLDAGQHQFPFKFKLPINNACSNPQAMARIGGMGGVGGYGPGGGLFGLGGVRVMDGSKQLFLRHVTATLPPSLTGFPMQAEIRYYIKVTVQRPGLLKENWRYQIGFKFLPIEPPRPPITGQEAFARRPFSFQQRTQAQKKRSSIFSSKKANEALANAGGDSPTAPSVEISARLPHPLILTCNQPIPLRLIAKKLVDSSEQIHLVSFQMDLIGVTEIRSHGLFHHKVNRWVVVSYTDLSIPLCAPGDEVGKELTLSDELWRNRALPNTVAPSFNTCNLSRKYEIELKIGVCWGKPKSGPMAKDPFTQPQTIFLPLHFANVNIFSGITPPAELLEAARNTRPGEVTISRPPRLPPRTSVSEASNPGPSARPPQRPSQPSMPPRPPQDPLYPPQLPPGDVPAYEDVPPPSYDEAMADNLAGPFDGLRPRPAYSGVTNENAPSEMPPEKR
ncbi:arrestin domain-containing [Trichoderma arundinaceum]|uniref:Arrestin domain-containing n=1 Tax=Trichoderma arundinaceum TaxID=490622 RepID=A0A395NHA4_TRIAR|nr:arrestin domain-containing [Trichoderma arundinaceum]